MQEIWRLDINTFEWRYINTTFDTPTSPLPPAREQHSAALVKGDLYVFGGKSRLHGVSPTGLPILTNKTDRTFNDFWKLQIEHSRDFNYSYHGHGVGQTLPHAIPQDGRLYLPISPMNTMTNQYDNTPRDGLCIQNVSVKVRYL